MSAYEEIEVSVHVKENMILKYSFNKEAISHYKQYVDSPDDRKGSIITMLWLKGNPNALRLDCGYDTFKKKMACPTVDISGLTEEQVQKISDLIRSFQKINRT